jgi:hypothetical protein
MTLSGFESGEMVVPFAGRTVRIASIEEAADTIVVAAFPQVSPNRQDTVAASFSKSYVSAESAWTDPALILAEMMADAVEARIQAEYDVYLKSDSWEQVPQPGDWAGLILDSPSRTFMENAVVEFAQRGIQIAGAEEGTVELRDIVVRANWLGILCNNTRATIVGANVYGQVIDAEAVPLPGGINPSGTGLMCIGLSQPVVSFSTLSNNEINGVGILSSAQPSFGEIDSSNSPGRNHFKPPRGQNYMFNGTPNDIYAQMSIWELLPGETVEDTIYDDTDDPALGMIIWEPRLTGIRTGVDSREWSAYP